MGKRKIKRKLSSLTSYEEWKKEIMKDPEFRRENDKLEPYYQVADQIIGAVIKQKISYGELAKRAKVSKTTIYRLIEIDFNPTTALLSKIASALGIEIKITIKPV